MAFDFPTSPTVGQKYPTSPIVGQPTYTWDGQKWTTQSIPVGGLTNTIYVSDTPPAGVAEKSLWWESDTGNLYVYYNDGTSFQWVVVCPQPDPAAISSAIAAVTYTAQTLTTPQRQQARQNIAAAPFDAESYLGLQINGSFEINQPFAGTGATVPNNGQVYFCDMWQAAASYGSGSFGAAQNALSNNPGFEWAGLLQCNPAPSSLAAGDYAFFQQPIEGYRCARLGWGYAGGGYPITVAFWVLCSRAGTANLAVRNRATNRVYVAPFTINNAATWEYKTITIPGDVTGTWIKTNDVGIYLSFCFRAGSTFTTVTPNTWSASSNFASPGISNFFQATNDGAWLTGVGVYPGNEAPSQARSMFATRHRDDDFRLCQRYYHRADEPTDVLIGQAYQTTHALIPWAHPVPMRQGPVWAGGGSFQMRSASASGVNVTAMAFNSSFPNYSEIDATVSGGGLVAGNAAGLLLGSGAYLAADARF
jgi:hypothetical protein